MTYDLYIGDRTFSSWSLRGWLMLDPFKLPCRVHMTGLYAGTFGEEMNSLAPARLVPVLRTPEGQLVGESMAIAETLAERHPDAGLWPDDPALRMRARWLCAEMASGFHALRSACPMQLQHVNTGFAPAENVQADVQRAEELWQDAWDLSGAQGGWLFGAYSLADVFYTPVAARIVGYNLDVNEDARAYCLRLLSVPSVLTWREAGLKVRYDPFPYPVFEPLAPWPLESDPINLSSTSVT